MELDIKGATMQLLPEQIEYITGEQLQSAKADKTFHIPTHRHLSSNLIDGLSAIKQAIFCILATEQGVHEIYPNDYGLQTLDLYSSPFGYVASELCRRIKESLIQDERITDVFDFQIERTGTDGVHILFNVETVYGLISEEYTIKVVEEVK